MPVEELLVESLSPRDRAFAFVAAAWMAGIDEDVDPEEQKLLDRAADLLELGERRAELARVARDLPPRKDGAWSDDIAALFRAIPRRLENDESIDVAFGS
jgi:hypothetical protein